MHPSFGVLYYQVIYPLIFSVWQKLNEQNPEFFKAYYTRLALKQQIEKFNELLEKQKELMDSQTNVASLPNSNESHIPASKFLSPLLSIIGQISTCILFNLYHSKNSKYIVTIPKT